MNAAPQRSAPGAAPLGADEAEALFAPLAGEPGLLVAVSGGPDSVALLALLADWARAPCRPPLHAATVDHGLRPEACTEAAGVAALCDRLGVAHRILTWHGPKPTTGVQAAARRARYDLLAEEALRRGGAAVATAHTLDDQAETLLMRLAHGSGPSGLAGMRPRSRRGPMRIVRPLLAVPKARLVATADMYGLPYVRDPGNADTRFERVRWRELAPLLAERGLDARRFGVLAQRLARQEEALAHVAAAALARARAPLPLDGVMRLNLGDVAGEPEDIVLRMLAAALHEITDNADGHGRLERLEACVTALRSARREGLAMRRTLSGCILALDCRGVLTIRPEGRRRRGIHPASS